MKLDPKLLKDWWWVVGLIVGAIVVWGNLPQRVAKAEEAIQDLKGWAQEVQGYTRAVQEQRQATTTDEKVAEAINAYVQQQAQQQLPMNAPAPEAQWFTEEDAQGCWECWGYSHEDCWTNQRWQRCAP